MLEALIDAIVNGAVGKQTGEATFAGIEQLFVGLNIKVGVQRM